MPCLILHGQIGCKNEIKRIDATTHIAISYSIPLHKFTYHHVNFLGYPNIYVIINQELNSIIDKKSKRTFSELSVTIETALEGRSSIPTYYQITNNCN